MSLRTAPTRYREPVTSSHEPSGVRPRAFSYAFSASSSTTMEAWGWWRRNFSSSSQGLAVRPLSGTRVRTTVPTSGASIPAIPSISLSMSTSNRRFRYVDAILDSQSDDRCDGACRILDLMSSTERESHVRERNLSPKDRTGIVKRDGVRCEPLRGEGVVSSSKGNPVFHRLGLGEQSRLGSRVVLVADDRDAPLLDDAGFLGCDLFDGVAKPVRMFQSDICDDGNLGHRDNVGSIVQSSETDLPHDHVDLSAGEVHDRHGGEDLENRDRIIFRDGANRTPYSVERVKKVLRGEHGPVDRDAFADIHE